MAKEKGFESVPWDVIRTHILPHIPMNEWENIALINKKLGGKFHELQNNCKAWFQRDFPERFSALENNVSNWIQEYYLAEQKSYARLSVNQINLIKAIKKNDMPNFRKYVEALKNETGEEILEFLENADPVERLNLLQWITFHASNENRTEMLDLIYSNLVQPQAHSNNALALEWAVYTFRPLNEIQQHYAPSKESHETLLFLACTIGHTELLNHLLDLPETLKPTISIEHVCALCRIMDNPTLVMKLLGKTLTEDDGLTLLNTACSHGRSNTVKKLFNHWKLHKVINREISEEMEGVTPFVRACSSGKTELVQFLLDKGAEVAWREPFIAAMPYPSVLRLLDPQKLNNEEQFDLFMYCCEFKAPDTVKVLMDKKIFFDAIRNGSQRYLYAISTPLQAACSRGSTVIASMLLKAGADPTSFHKLGRSPLHMACAKDDVHMVKLLLDFQPEKQLALNCSGSTPLHVACTEGKNIGVIKLLLDKGANPNLYLPTQTAPSGYRNSALYAALHQLAKAKIELETCRTKDFPSLKKRIEKAKETQKNIRQLSEILDVLLAYPSKMRQADLNRALREECRSMATTNTSKKIIDYLLKAGADSRIIQEEEERKLEVYKEKFTQQSKHERTCKSAFSKIKDKKISTLLEPKFSATLGDLSIQSEHIRVAAAALNNKVPYKSFKEMIDSKNSQALNFLFTELLDEKKYEKMVKPAPMESAPSVEPTESKGNKKTFFKFLHKG